MMINCGYPIGRRLSTARALIWMCRNLCKRHQKSERSNKKTHTKKTTQKKTCLETTQGLTGSISGCCSTSSPRRCREGCGGGGGGGGGRGPPAAADAERRLVHGGAEEGEDAQQRPGPAAPAHAQVLHQRTLLQPQGHRLPTSYLQTQAPPPPDGGALSHILLVGPPLATCISSHPFLNF